MKLRWQGFREKYGCDECGHRDWQWPIVVIRPRPAGPMAAFIPELWMKEMQQNQLLGRTIDSKYPGTFSKSAIIHIPSIGRTGVQHDD